MVTDCVPIPPAISPKSLTKVMTFIKVTIFLPPPKFKSFIRHSVLPFLLNISFKEQLVIMQQITLEEKWVFWYPGDIYFIPEFLYVTLYLNKASLSGAIKLLKQFWNSTDHYFIWTIIANTTNNAKARKNPSTIIHYSLTIWS